MDVATERERDQDRPDRLEGKRRTSREIWHSYLCETADSYARLAEEYRRRAEELYDDEGGAD